MYGCESWTIKKAEHQRIGAFELWCWRRLLRVLWTARRSNQSILKEINPEWSLEGLMLKLPYLATWCEELTHWKSLWAEKDWGQEEKGTTKDEMVGWHQVHWIDGHEFEQTPGDGGGWGSLGTHKESDTTDWLTIFSCFVCLLKSKSNSVSSHEVP